LVVAMANSLIYLSNIRLGAGTGIFTRALLVHPGWTSDIKAIKAIEPSAGMRDVFSQTVKDNRVTIGKGTFEETGIDDQWADLVIIAQVRIITITLEYLLKPPQAFHWCPDYDRASAEFSRILKPDGAAIFIWNLEDRYTRSIITRGTKTNDINIRDAARWVAQLRDHIEKHENGTPQFRLGLWRQTFDTPPYQRAFLPPIEKSWPYTLPATVDTAVDRAASKSYIAVLPEDEKAEALSSVKMIVQKGEDKVWIDEAKDLFEYPYKCYVVVSQKK
jgi:hypothetical protein